VLVGQPHTSILVEAHVLAQPCLVAAAVPSELSPQDDGANDWSFTSALRSAVRPYLGDGCADLAYMAEVVGTSKRTLQRRLQSCGRTFSEVVQQARFSRLPSDDGRDTHHLPRHRRGKRPEGFRHRAPPIAHRIRRGYRMKATGRAGQHGARARLPRRTRRQPSRPPGPGATRVAGRGRALTWWGRCSGSRCRPPTSCGTPWSSGHAATRRGSCAWSPLARRRRRRSPGSCAGSRRRHPETAHRSMQPRVLAPRSGCLGMVRCDIRQAPNDRNGPTS
jgi:hypothetical protein